MGGRLPLWRPGARNPTMILSKTYAEELLEAALDQPNPTKRLVWALQDVLTLRRHPDRDKSRDVKAER